MNGTQAETIAIPRGRGNTLTPQSTTRLNKALNLSFHNSSLSTRSRFQQTSALNSPSCFISAQTLSFCGSILSSLRDLSDFLTLVKVDGFDTRLTSGPKLLFDSSSSDNGLPVEKRPQILPYILTVLNLTIG